jgi:hypothetical protein
MTREQAKDTGMAMVLILLIIGVTFTRPPYLVIAIVVHVVNMIAPQLFKPVAVVWFGLSTLMGTVVSKMVLAVIFFAIVTPIGLIRRISGVDGLHLRAFKQGHGSVMVQRNHTFTASDFDNPY